MEIIKEIVKMDDKTVRKNIAETFNRIDDIKACFVVLSGQDIGKNFEINKKKFFIGRNPKCDIHVNDEEVSRKHARVEITPTGINIHDLGSTNGTLVNGMKVKKHTLQDGDRVQIGTFTILKFNYLDALENTFNEELYNNANRDFLTGVYNKKYFLDRLGIELSYSKRHTTPLSLIFFDIDHFKKINDKYGHLAGDYILKEMVSKIKSEKRQEDLLARYGGEEFVLLLRDCTAQQALIIAENMRKSIKSHKFKFEKKQMKVTISVGIAVWMDQNFKSMDEFIAAADKELYKAKNAGRDQTSCSQLDSDEE